MNEQKKPIKKIDIYNENFNNFFTEKLNQITPKQRSLIPNDLAFKIYKHGDKASSEHLTFQEKLWILSVAFSHSVTIMVHDKERGIGMRDFGKASQANEGKILNGELLEDMRIHSTFVMADKELMTASLYMNHVSCSNIYSLIKEIVENANHSVNKKFVKAKKDMNTILSFLTNYEATKRRIAMDYELTMPQWYALLYFSTGNDKLGVDFAKRDFKYAYASNAFTLQGDMKKLVNRGFLFRRGVKGTYKYYLTAAGVNLLNRIMDNIVLKF